MPRGLGIAAEAVLDARGQSVRLKRVLDGSAVPMLMVDGRRRYVEVNRPARLTFRMSLAEMRGLTVDDLTPPQALWNLETVWARLLETGCVAGLYDVAGPDGSRFHLLYWAVADALPGLHLGAFALADWPEDELSRDGEHTDVRLTRREREVLELAAEGLSGPQIAERLVLSPATVKTHFDHIYEKLDVHDRAGAVARSLRLSLIY